MEKKIRSLHLCTSCEQRLERIIIRARWVRAWNEITGGESPPPHIALEEEPGGCRRIRVLSPCGCSAHPEEPLSGHPYCSMSTPGMLQMEEAGIVYRLFRGDKWAWYTSEIALEEAVPKLEIKILGFDDAARIVVTPREETGQERE